MGGWGCRAAFSLFLGASLCGCAFTEGVYHDVEGGAISKVRQAPPGMNLPYPNLADVPPAVTPSKPGTQAAIAAQARGGVSSASPGALAGLSLPAGVPPLPDVPGLGLPAAPTPVPMPASAPPPPAAPAPKPGPPIAIGFAPNKALLPFDQGRKIQKAVIAAAAHGPATVIAGGFGGGSLTLALERARRLADALTAAGMPAGAIILTASAKGSGGFVQFVY